MKRIGLFIVIGLLVGAAPTEAGKGGNGKPGGEPPDPAIAYTQRKDFWGPNQDLVLMDADGSNKTVIFSEGAMAPCWSPDGTQILFGSEVWGSGIYVIDRDGTNLRKVVDVYSIGAAVPTWSPVPAPDGKYKVAFVDSVGASGKPDEVFLVNLDGTGLQQLTATAPDLYYWDVTWAPDATTLAVNAVREDETGLLMAGDIVLLELGLTNGEVSLVDEINVTSDADVPGGLLNDAVYFANVEWSKAGNRLAVTVGVENHDTDLWVIDLDDPANPTQVTDTPDFSELVPTWSSDDSRIAYYEIFSGAVYVIDVDGSNRQVLAQARGRAVVNNPDWRR